MTEKLRGWRSKGVDHTFGYGGGGGVGVNSYNGLRGDLRGYFFHTSAI